MNIVVDTSVVIAVVVNEPIKARIIALTQGAHLFAPTSLHAEMGNAFSAMIKRNRATLQQARSAIQIYRQIPLNLTEIDLEQALNLSSQLNIYAYDTYVLACALNRGCPLLTLDRGLIHAAKLAGAAV